MDNSPPASASQIMLRQQNYFLQAIIDGIPVPVYYKDVEGKYLGCNKAFEKLTNIKRTDLIGRSSYSSSPLQTSFFSKQMELSLLESDEIETQYEKELVLPDGTQKTFLHQKSVFIGPDGIKIGIVGVLLDISVLKEQGKLLEESKRRYKRLVEVSPFATILHQEGKIIYANDAAMRILCAEKNDDVINKNYFDFVQEDLIIMEQHRIKEMSKNKGTEVPLIEGKFKTCKNQTIDIETASTSFETSDNKIVIQTVFHEITERKKAEKELKDNRNLLSITLHSIADGVVSTDNNGLILGLNVAAEEMVGFKEIEVIGKPLKDYVKFANQLTKKEVLSPVDIVISTGNAIFPRNNTVLITTTGKEIPIKHNAAPIIDEIGNMTGVVMVFKDVTYDYAYQDRLVRSEKLAAIGLMASGIAHEFNNINNVIKGHVDLMCIDEIPEKWKKSLDAIQTALQKCATITTDLLTFTRESKKNILPTRPYDLINQIVSMVKMDFEKEGIIIEVEEKTKAKICVNAQNISHVFMNLFINAKHAMLKSKTKKLSITIEDSNDVPNEYFEREYVIIKIKDTGCGIEEKHLAKIFTPFFSTKGNNAERDSWQAELKGTGLGLSICHDIIMRQHNGNIRVDTEINKGTTFFLYLPKFEETHNKAKEEFVYEKGQGERVLILDENNDATTLLIDVVKGEGYNVTQNNNWDEAISSHTAKHSDAVIIDSKMCGENVEKILEAFNGAVKIIFSRTNAVNSTNIYYMKKPCDLSELIVNLYTGLKKRKNIYGI